MSVIPKVRINVTGQDYPAVEDLAIFDADYVRIENLGGRYWMAIRAHGVLHTFSIIALMKGVPVVEIEDSIPDGDNT